MATVSTFLRAIHAGAVHFKHSDVLLANYGRLGPSFDLCTKVTIDVPRKEGMYNHDGDMVVEVKYDSLQRTLAPPDDARLQSVSLVMDVAVKDEERMAGLAKQLAVVRRPDSRYVVCSRCLRLVTICVLQGGHALEPRLRGRS
jgi:cohesin complex subunit SA-1/2